ncbi:carboxyl-terminal processing protease CtpA [Myxacorys almedinensis]|uniref:Carboxyl-terminal-processing protease n=1 Tax=Myxacorys almedinensis A TaxID=2690445 RepID=A0A8J8CIS6_9CYAN|nr:carboxyl-terminal processing protease CtpA [Myxacorys almedinensis]NDJ16851.1 PDZ domain-containing protein [Myxacorys almedinensis A]
MGRRFSGFRLLIIGVLSVAIAFGVVSPANALTDDQKLLNEAWRIIDRAYVDSTFNHKNWWGLREKYLRQPLPDREATYAAIAQMLAVLDDPFTRLLKPDQYRSLQTTTSGELTGVGLQIALDLETKLLKVIAPIEGSPAAKSGIQVADTILKIDGVSTEGLSLDEAAERMRGKIGSQVTLTVAREGQAAQEMVLVRDRIALNPVVAELRPQASGKKVGYVKLSQFNANATMEVAHAIASLEKQGAEAYILDLRNNPGGLLNAGVEIARLWLNEGTIVYTVNRQGTIGSFEAVGSALTDDPLVVLVNQGTASASEILAGALHDNRRATVVGEKTFGKGLIQSLFDLSDGAGLAVTVAKYETPSHTDINKLGIKPDRVVALDHPVNLDQIGTAVDNQYQAAIETVTSEALVAGTT